MCHELLHPLRSAVQTRARSRIPATTPQSTIATLTTQQLKLQMAQNEGRTLLALQAYEQGHFTSLRAAARAYSTLSTTLQRRKNRTTSRSDYTLYNLKLSQTKESTLVN